ncbi:MAG: HNH endonuclease [Mariprofundaceae bacterium]|nr:HNH endonuclease [Mariprofundaceae bacterium]
MSDDRHHIVWDRDLQQARAEHRILLEQRLGRRLRPDEVVHHKNEKKMDNRLRNLAVMPLRDHVALHRRKFMLCQARLCRRPHHAKGLCNTHHRQWLRTGARPEMRRR